MAPARYGTFAEAARLNLRDDVELKPAAQSRHQTLSRAPAALAPAWCLSGRQTRPKDLAGDVLLATGGARGRRRARPRRLRRRRRAAPTARPCAAAKTLGRVDGLFARPRYERRQAPPPSAAPTACNWIISPPTARRASRTSGSWRASSRACSRPCSSTRRASRAASRSRRTTRPSSLPTTRAACGRSRTTGSTCASSSTRPRTRRRSKTAASRWASTSSTSL